MSDFAQQHIAAAHAASGIPEELSLSEPAQASADDAVATTSSRFLRRFLFLEAVALLTLAHLLVAGYGLGVGNQTIQIPFLRHWMNPQLFQTDPMVAGTLKSYPSYFFQGLAFLVKKTGAEVGTVYFILHLLTTYGVLLAAYGLARAMFKSHFAGLITMLLLFAGHHRALAGDEMYSIGFTHTWAVFPLAILALIFLYKEYHALAFLLAGLLFNLHALTAAYLFAMFGLWAVWEFRRIGIPKLVILVTLFVLPAFPTLLQMARQQGVMKQQHAVWDQDWQSVTRIRSADHTFPSTWWQAGSPDVPRFLMILALAGLALSFRGRYAVAKTPAIEDPTEQQLLIEEIPVEDPARWQTRKTLLMAAAVGILFLVGYLATEIKPVAVVMRAQLFRASRLLLILAFACIGNNIAQGLRLMWRNGGNTSPTEPGDENAPPVISEAPRSILNWRGILEGLSAICTFLCMAFPGLLPYLPIALLVATLVAVINGRLSLPQATFIGMTGLVLVAAWRSIQFHIPGLHDDDPASVSQYAAALTGAARHFSLHASALAAKAFLSQFPFIFWMSFLSAVAIYLLSRLRQAGTLLRVASLVEGVVVIALVALTVHRMFARDTKSDLWVQAQLWAKQNTPSDQLFLTPALKGGFRIHSDRPVVCEWRDGTQAYFSPTYSKEWWADFQKLQPGVMFDQSGKRRISAGKSLGDLGDDAIISIARSTGAGYVVLPTPKKERNLKPVYQNSEWSIYQATSLVPVGAASKQIWLEQERFMDEVVYPNIEKNRKSDVKLTVADAQGNSLANAQVVIHQTRNAFGFGCSLPFFQEVEGDAGGRDYHPAPVTQQELDRFVEAGFNYSVIPFSAKWCYLEPVEGQRRYEELDKYVDWCLKHDVELEFHYLSGFMPPWAQYKSSAQQQQLFLKHCQQTMDRYADRIKKWQIINDERLFAWAPPVFKWAREHHPELKLGISDCTKFYNMSGRNGELYRGSDEVESLQAEGIQLDFFSMHGHSPHGLWADARSIYQSLDYFKRYGVRINVSEFLCPPTRIYGPIMSGAWTPELQAEYYERFYTILFSHPSVDAINYWVLGPDSIEEGTGLLDEKYQPKATFYKLKELITKKWRTNLDTTLSSDGTASFRGYHGKYDITVTLPSGKEVKGTFEVKPGDENIIKLRADEATGRLSM